MPLFLLCKLSGLGGPELAFGWMVNRATRRFQRPVSLGLAGALSTIFPSLQGYAVSALIIPPAVTVGANGQQRSLIDQNVEEMKELGYGSQADKMRRGINFIEGPIDKFGFAYLVTAKILSLSTMLGCVIALNSGFDLQAWLAQHGLLQTIGDNFGPLAAAVCLNTPLWPIHVLGATVAAPYAEKQRKVFEERRQARFERLRDEYNKRDKDRNEGD